jgi:glycosyltransferase involved in cell wall biosynthesis
MKKEKDILFIVENLPVPPDRRVWQEAISLKRAGYGISIICPKGKGFTKDYENINGIHIYRYPQLLEARTAIEYLFEYSSALFWELYLSIKIFMKRGFSVIHACNPPDLVFLIGALFKLMYKKKYVYDHHDLFPEMWIAKGGKRGIIYKLLLKMEKLSFISADISITTSESYKEIAFKRGKMKESDIFLVRSSPSYDDYLRHIPPIINTVTKGKGPYCIGYLGVMAKQDGLDYLLKSADYLINNKKRDDMYFVLVGSGPEWDNLIKFSQELHLDRNVVFKGWKDGKELIDILADCDICVCPEPKNVYNDSSSLNKILEYMALGKPIVQYDLTESKLLAGAASLYAKPNDPIDFADKILFLLENPVYRKAMGELGRSRFYKYFSWEKSETELYRAYEHLWEK